MTGKKIRRIELRCPPCEFLGRRGVPLEHERDGRIEQDLRRQRIQFDRARALGDRFVEPSLEGQRHAELIVRERVVGIERERPPEFALAPCPVVFVEQLEHGERGVRFGGIVVQFDGLLGCRLGLGPRFGGGEEAFVVPGPEVRVRQSRERRRKVRTQPDGFLELRDRLLQVLVAWAIEEVSALEIRIVRLGIDARRGGQPRLLARRQPHVDLPGDRRRQFRLERQHVARAALEALGPEVLVRPRVDQLRRDPHLVAGRETPNLPRPRPR